MAKNWFLYMCVYIYDIVAAAENRVPALPLIITLSYFEFVLVFRGQVFGSNNLKCVLLSHKKACNLYIM